MATSNSSKKIAVVIGYDHQNTLGVIRSLGEADFAVKAVLITEHSSCSTAKSKYIDDAILVKDSNVVDNLVSLAGSYEKKLPLIPCGDELTRLIALNYNRLSDLFYLPSTNCSIAMNDLMNKITMMEIARSAGLNVPNWISLKNNEFSKLQEHCAKFRYPIIIKPITLLKNGKFEFRIVKNADELADSILYLQLNCETALIQEYIEKIEEFGVNGCRLIHSAQTVFGGVVEKSRFSQSSLGSTTAGIICEDRHGLYELASKFVEMIDYRGIFDMEFISDGQKIYFIEMNFRNGGYGYAFTKAGRNFPAIWSCEAIGKSILELTGCPIKSIFFINETADIQNVRARNLRFYKWFWDVIRAKAHMYINRKDMKPFFNKVFRMK